MGKAEEELKVISDLKRINGLSNFIVLNENDKKFILNNEKKNNVGVLEAVKRKYLIAFTHDSSFRKPAEKIVIKKNNKKIFPPVSFPEVKARNVVSCSPGYKVDSYLRKKIGNVNEEDATLLVGFD